MKGIKVFGAIAVVVLLYFAGGGGQTETDTPAPAAPPTSGTGCIYQYSSFQNDVVNDLSWLNLPILAKFSCEDQKRELDILGHFPPDERNEEFDRFIDEVTRKQSPG